MWDFCCKGSYGWGFGFIYMLEMENVMKFVLECSLWDFIEMVIFYLMVFYLRNDSEVVEW